MITKIKAAGAKSFSGNVWKPFNAADAKEPREGIGA